MKTIMLLILGLCIMASSSVFAALPTYECHRACGPIKIDGKMDERDWKRAPSVKFCVPVSGAKPKQAAIGKVLWDDKYLYVGIKAYDSDIKGSLTERGSSVWDDDCLEVFVRTSLEKTLYYELDVNPLNTLFDARFTKKWERVPNWLCEGIQTAVFIKGTLNNSKDKDQYWQMEMAVPFASLPSIDGKTPAIGDMWSFQLARFNYSVYLANSPELSANVALSSEDYHLLDEWQPLVFVK